LDFPPLAPDEPLSPELVLVLPLELRACVLASMGKPLWPTPRRRPVERPARLRLAETAARPGSADIPALLEEPSAPSLGAFVGVRLVQLALIFVAVTVVTLAMSLVANAFR
jgi:hypothetical protein